MADSGHEKAKPLLSSSDENSLNESMNQNELIISVWQLPEKNAADNCWITVIPYLILESVLKSFWTQNF